MMPMLDEAYRTVNEVYVQPRLRRFKTRAMIAVVSGLVLALFLLLGLICLFMMVFLGLAKAYDPQTAATILFGFCVLTCIGTLIVHAIARSIEDRHDREARFSMPVRKPSKLLTDKEHGPDMKGLVQDYFAENKMSALAAVAVAGVLIGARPGLALKTMSWALRRKAKKALRGR